MTNICQVIGVEEAVRMVCSELEKLAAPNKIQILDQPFDNVRRVKNVQVWFHPDKAGIALFFFVTHDNVSAQVEIDFGALTRDYLDKKLQEVQSKINEHRGKRDPLVVRHPKAFGRQEIVDASEALH